MDSIGWIIVGAGIILGCFIAFLQWHDDKIKGSKVLAFLDRIKSCDLLFKAVEQVNTMLARLDPPKRITFK